MNPTADLRCLGRVGTAFATTTFFLGAAELHRTATSQRRRQEVFDNYQRRWARRILDIMGVSLTLDVHESRANLSHGAVRPAFVVCNHRSALDILLLCAHFGGALLSRADLARWPMIGFVARRAGTIFVERDATKSRISAMRQIRETLGSGRGVCLFPEGGTYDGDEVRPFFPGGFAAARGLDVDIVPVGLAYPDGFEFGQHSFADHARQVASRSKNPVAMVVGQAQANLPKAAEAAEHFRSEVQALTLRARSLLQTTVHAQNAAPS